MALRPRARNVGINKVTAIGKRSLLGQCFCLAVMGGSERGITIVCTLFLKKVLCLNLC